jgi:hypothetical protein
VRSEWRRPPGPGPRRRQDFAFVGIVEHYAASLCLLKYYTTGALASTCACGGEFEGGAQVREPPFFPPPRRFALAYRCTRLCGGVHGGAQTRARTCTVMQREMTSGGAHEVTHGVPPHSVEADVVPAVREAVGELTRVDAREKKIGGQGGLLNPSGPLLTHLHTVYMAYSECLSEPLDPLAEGTSPLSPRPLSTSLSTASLLYSLW